jgi:hypothetical protein
MASALYGARTLCRTGFLWTRTLLLEGLQNPSFLPFGFRRSCKDEVRVRRLMRNEGELWEPKALRNAVNSLNIVVFGISP